VVAIPPTTSAIVIVVVVVVVAVVVVVVVFVVVVAYYPLLRMIYLIVVCMVVTTAAAALDRLRPPLQPKTIASRWTTGSNRCCCQPLPLLPGRRSEGRSMQQRPSIVSVAAMVAGGDDGLPWRRAGR
jgi:hypothetical protein